MIPTGSTGAITLRKLRGRFDAFRQGFALERFVVCYAGLAAPDRRRLLGVLLPLLMVLAAIVAVIVNPHPASLAFLGVAGTTTGTKSSGTDFIGLNDMLKQVYTKPFENNVEADSEVADLIDKAEGFEVVDGPDGKQINIGHIFSSGGGVGVDVGQDDYLPTPTRRRPSSRASRSSSTPRSWSSPVRRFAA
jgi:hypothetical protein